MDIGRLGFAAPSPGHSSKNTVMRFTLMPECPLAQEQAGLVDDILVVTNKSVVGVNDQTVFCFIQTRIGQFHRAIMFFARAMKQVDP